MSGVNTIGENLAYLGQVSQWESTVWWNPENCEKIIEKAQQTLIEIKSSNVSSIDLFRLKILARRIHEKMSIPEQDDPLRKIWNLCFDIDWQILKAPSPAESSNFLKDFSVDSFKKFYSTFENRKCVLELLEINKNTGSYQELVKKIEGWILFLERPLSQQNLSLLIPDLNARGKHSSALVSFKQLLQCHGFSSTVNDIDFSVPKIVEKYWGTGKSGSILHYIDFSNVTFIKCTFTWVNLSNSLFKHCFFQKCDFSFCFIKRSGKFIETRFEDCQMTRAFLHHSLFKNSTFTRCDLQYASLFGTQVENVLMEDCIQNGTSFLGANIGKGCKMTSRESLKDCLFFGAEKKFGLSKAEIPPSLKCKIGFWWNLEYPSPTTRKAETSIIKSDCLPIRGDDNPDDVNPISLRAEINSILSTLSSHKLSGSIVQEIIHTVQETDTKHFPEFKKLIQKSKQLVENIDCLLLPGGKDIEGEFYNLANSTPNVDYRRTLLEFLSIYFARERGLPIVGICRGMQLTGVYHGAQLIPHIPGQMIKLQEYSMKASEGQGEGLIRSFMKTPISGLSMHHQALMPGTVPQKLEVVSIREKVIKAAEGTIGAPILLFQWHPEIQSDPNDQEEECLFKVFPSTNLDMLKTFYNIGEVIQSKKKVAEELASKII